MHAYTHKLIASFLAIASIVAASPLTLADGLASYPQTFIISAYYSPVAGQSVYFRGSFEADKKLNGNGINGADGTPVYAGMLAGPKSYPFGTRLSIPGLGVGTVHDRGGAIVDAGVRSNAYDRIDVWMGSGEEGLARALAWGMRTVTATVYHVGVADAPAEAFDLPTNLATLDNLKKTQLAAMALPADLRSGDTGATVTKLQTYLKTIGLLRADVTGTFDDATLAGVVRYQQARRVITDATETGAGIVAGRTRELLNTEINAKKGTLSLGSLLGSSILKSGSSSTTSTPAAVASRTLTRGDTGDDVRAMQAALASIGTYTGTASGTFDTATEDALIAFQEGRNIVKRGEYGSGVYGPKTSTALIAAVVEATKKAADAVAAALPTGNVNLGDATADAKKLQAGLIRLGYLTSAATGTFDAAARDALISFQISAGIIAGKNEFGAGVFGPKTRTAFNEKLKTAIIAGSTTPSTTSAATASTTTPTAAASTSTNAKTTATGTTTTPTVTATATPTFTKNLAYGDTGIEVAKLQKTLAKLGHYTATPTSTFDATTRDALTHFQIAATVITAPTDFGAGTFGPKTRAALTAEAARKNITVASTN